MCSFELVLFSETPWDIARKSMSPGGSRHSHRWSRFIYSWRNMWVKGFQNIFKHKGNQPKF